MKSVLTGKRMRTPRVREEKTEPEPAPKFTPRGSENLRLLVAIKDDRIDFQAMPPESSKKLNELLHTPEVQAQFGIGPLSDHFDPQQCKVFYDAFGQLLQTLGRLVLHMPAEALRVLLYTPEEKDLLAAPTAKALDELAPRWVKEHQALATFLVLFGSITQKKIGEAVAVTRALALKALAEQQSGKPSIVSTSSNRRSVVSSIAPATAAGAPANGSSL